MRVAAIKAQRLPARVEMEMIEEVHGRLSYVKAQINTANPDRPMNRIVMEFRARVEGLGDPTQDLRTRMASAPKDFAGFAIELSQLFSAWGFNLFNTCPLSSSHTPGHITIGKFVPPTWALTSTHPALATDAVILRSCILRVPGKPVADQTNFPRA